MSDFTMRPVDFVPRRTEVEELTDRLEQVGEILGMVQEIGPYYVDQRWPGFIEDLISTSEQLQAAAVGVIEDAGFRWDNERD